MDTTRISFGEMIAGVGGLALFIVMWLPWYGLSADIGFASINFNAWESFDLIDIILFLVALVAVGAVAARAAGAVPTLPVPIGQIVAAAGALAVLLILYRLIDTPGGDTAEGIDVTRKVGAFLGLLAAAAIAFGGYTAMQEEATGRAPGRRPPAV